MKKTLVTAFKPFSDFSVNPSQILLEGLQKEIPTLSTCLLPVEFEGAFKTLSEVISVLEPSRIIMMGLADKRNLISLEKIALNWNETLSPDETQFTPPIAKIDQSEELALMTNYGIDELYNMLKQQNLPVELSFSAGTYVCNNLYFKVLKHFPKTPAIFIHVPQLGEINGGLNFETQLRVIKNIVEYR